MATIKSYTDISQSKKLAEILPLESADMHYCLENRDVATGYEIGIVPFIQAKRFKGKCSIVDVQPAWSLASLLGVLPEYNLQRTDWETKTEYKIVVTTDEDNYASKNYNNPVDACVAIIEKLNELKLL